MLRANFKDDPMAHLIAPRCAYNKAASGAAITRYTQPTNWRDHALRAVAFVALAATGLLLVGWV
jgi:hypothetical protein